MSQPGLHRAYALSHVYVTLLVFRPLSNAFVILLSYLFLSLKSFTALLEMNSHAQLFSPFSLIHVHSDGGANKKGTNGHKR